MESNKDWNVLHRSYKQRFRNAKKAGISFKPTDDEREAHRLYGAKYATTGKGRAILRAGSRKYHASEKGKIKDAIYNRSEKHKKSTQQWQATYNGKLSRLRAQARFRNHKPPEHANKESLVSIQNNRCAICHREFNSDFPARLDHCHKTGEVRGALCDRCNLALGLFDDNTNSLRCAFDYLTKCKRVGEVDLEEIGLREKAEKEK